MGVINSTLGPIKQKVGNLRFSKWKNKNVVARQPEGYNDANTLEQQINRSKFAQASLLSRQLTPLLRKGFKNQAQDVTVQNVFVSKLLKANLAANTIDKNALSLMQIAMGQAKAPSVSDFKIDPTNGEIAVFQNATTNGTTGLGTDMLQATVIDSNTLKTVVIQDVMTRSASSANKIIDDLRGVDVAACLVLCFYIRPSTNVVSDSNYTEPVIL
jgi:Family of unknown function (DUF6266)